jgi:hypothetical protein
MGCGNSKNLSDAVMGNEDQNGNGQGKSEKKQSAQTDQVIDFAASSPTITQEGTSKSQKEAPSDPLPPLAPLDGSSPLSQVHVIRVARTASGRNLVHESEQEIRRVRALSSGDTSAFKPTANRQQSREPDMESTLDKSLNGSKLRVYASPSTQRGRAYSVDAGPPPAQYTGLPISTPLSNNTLSPSVPVKPRRLSGRTPIHSSLAVQIQLRTASHSPARPRSGANSPRGSNKVNHVTDELPGTPPSTQRILLTPNEPVDEVAVRWPTDSRSPQRMSRSHSPRFNANSDNAVVTEFPSVGLGAIATLAAQALGNKEAISCPGSHLMQSAFTAASLKVLWMHYAAAPDASTLSQSGHTRLAGDLFEQFCKRFRSQIQEVRKRRNQPEYTSQELEQELQKNLKIMLPVVLPKPRNPTKDEYIHFIYKFIFKQLQQPASSNPLMDGENAHLTVGGTHSRRGSNASPALAGNRSLQVGEWRHTRARSASVSRAALVPAPAADIISPERDRTASAGSHGDGKFQDDSLPAAFNLILDGPGDNSSRLILPPLKDDLIIPPVRAGLPSLWDTFDEGYSTPIPGSGVNSRRGSGHLSQLGNGTNSQLGSRQSTRPATPTTEPMEISREDFMQHFAQCHHALFEKLKR